MVKPMRQLDRKVVRDLMAAKGQAIAIGLVIACGVATFVMSLSTLESLKISRQLYFDRYQFADVFAHLKRAPSVQMNRIREIPGVAFAEPRIVMNVTLDVPGLNEPAIGMLQSVPDIGRPVMNKIHLRAGRYVEPRRKGEVIASEAFAEAHGFQPNDTLHAVINGRRQELTIVGIALSPEHIFQVRAGDILPDHKRYGVFWMGESELAAAFDMEGAFNDITLKLTRGASEQTVIRQLDVITKPYGGVGAYGRDEQLSARYLADEIRGLRGMGMIAPAIFLGVAAFLLNMVLTRIVANQREQIAALKAFGYTPLQIGIHYFKLVVIISLLGVLLGILIGARMGTALTRMYSEFYRFPVFYFRFDWGIAVLAVGISLCAAIVGTWRAVYAAVILPPAEAMNPEPPADYRPTIIERTGLQLLFSQTSRMILRQLERRPGKALLSVVGISFAVATLILGNFMVDALDYLIEFQFFKSQRHNVMVTLIEPTSASARFELGQLPGVMQSETFRSVSTKMHFGHRSHRVGIMGIPRQRELFRLLDADGHLVNLPEQGLLISDKLAKMLHVQPGDTLTVEVLEGKRPILEIPVVATITDFAGTNVYMSAESLSRFMQEGSFINGAYMTVDGNQLDELYTQLKNMPGVAGVSVKEATLVSFNETIAENQLRMQMFNIIFACVIAFGVIYNTARISFSERSREMATLRVIGFTRREVSMILLGELAVITLAAIPLGMLIGYGFAALTVSAFESELFRIPLVISRNTLGFATLVTILASLFSGLVVQRRVHDLDLIAVLKSSD